MTTDSETPKPRRIQRRRTNDVRIERMPSEGLRKQGRHAMTMYRVSRLEEIIGYVRKRAESSYRSDGTGSPYRWGFRGYSVTWQFRRANKGDYEGLFYRRTAAIKQLLEITNA